MIFRIDMFLKGWDEEREMAREMYLGKNRLTGEYFFDNSNHQGDNRNEKEGLGEILSIIKVSIGDRKTVLHTIGLPEGDLMTVQKELRRYPVKVEPVKE